MFTLDITKWLPRFLLNDKNGHALARAIEAGLQAMNDIVDLSLKRTFDSDSMPEWRLDEMAYEYNALYDYGESIEAKRNWIANATEYYAKYGTAKAIVKYLEGIFDSVAVEEWWQYGGDPYHFQVIVTGESSQAKNAWTIKAISQAKNVRSVLDNVIYTVVENVTATLYIAAAASGVEIEDEAIPVE